MFSFQRNWSLVNQRMTSIDLLFHVPMPTIPICRSPAGYAATGGQSSKAEHRYTAGGIPIHRLPIRVPENRKTIHIIPGVSPRHRGAPSIPAHAHRCTRIQRIIMHNTRAEPHCSQCRCCQNCHLVLHCRKKGSSLLMKRNSAQLLFEIFNLFHTFHLFFST